MEAHEPPADPKEAGYPNTPKGRGHADNLGYRRELVELPALRFCVKNVQKYSLRATRADQSFDHNSRFGPNLEL